MAWPVPWLHAVVGAAVLFGVLRPAAAQEKKYVRMVVRYVGHHDDGKYRYMGKPTMLLAVEPLEGGRTVELVVPNKGQGDIKNDKYDPIPQVAETVRELKRGDVIKIELDHSKPRPFVREAKRYELKPGEEDPNAYVFQSNFRKEDGRSRYMAVVLSRYGEQTTVAVQQKRDKEGDMVSDPAVLEMLQNLKAGEIVEAEIRETGSTPVLTSLERYAPPQNARFIKLTETDVEGQKAPAVELEREGKPMTAIVVGKMQAKRWTPDGKVLAAAKKLKPDADVVFRARDANGRLVLKEIREKEVPQGAASASRRTSGGDDQERPARRGGDRDAGRSNRDR